MNQHIVVASNRGPVSFGDDGTPHRGSGGLVSVLDGALREREFTWISAAMSQADRMHELPGVRMLDIPEKEYDAYYNRMSNRVLWFVHHYLFDPPRTPVFDADDFAAWDAYVNVNHRFASAIAEFAPKGAACLIQDYHLALVPPILRSLRSDVKISQFWHIPFAQTDYLRMLPDEWSRTLMEGLLGADVMGFQTARWARSFRQAAQDIVGARVSERWAKHAGRTTRVAVYPVGVDADKLKSASASPEVRKERTHLLRWLRDRKMLLRVDRMELSKNILRGLMAYEALLERRPELGKEIAHLGLLLPSRSDVPEYAAYTKQCLAAADRINDRFGTDSVRLDLENSFPRTLAAYSIYDGLMVNSVFDGMNLVAYEGPILNRRDGTLILSHNAGAFMPLGAAAIGINPFSVEATAEAIEQAMQMPPVERKERARRLRRLARSHTPARWLLAQIRDLERTDSGAGSSDHRAQ
ncbi:MAG: alpha,alpha-trehalose-phosphate synthase (UDP-forming) [Actinomycetota bacterium]